MLNTLKKLAYISLKETENLDDVNIIYVEHNGGVFTKKMRCDFFEIDNLNTLPDAVEQLFIDKIISMVKPIYVNLKETKAAINTYFDAIKPINDKHKNTDRFIIFSNDINKEFINETFEYPVHILASEYLDDNLVIFGYKTKVDQPGIVLVTNKEGIKHKNKIRLTVNDIGYHSNKAYYVLKIK
jgi:hypothetical protein